jgi:DNA-directed RNA polymerase III subunit RPC5
MRTKLKTGFMELDIATNVTSNFDKSKGLLWGSALKSANDSGAAGFGMASGFGKGSRANELFAAEGVRGKRRAGEKSSRLTRFNDANEAGRVLNKQTLGGQIIKPEPGKPMYMLGTFRDSEYQH